MFPEHVLCARHHLGIDDTSMNEIEIPAHKELVFSGGRKAILYKKKVNYHVVSQRTNAMEKKKHTQKNKEGE